MELDRMDKVIIAYSKGHYGYKNILKLKTILANVCGLKADWYDNYMAYTAIVRTYSLVATPNMIDDLLMRMFNQDVFGYRLSPQPITFELVIDDLLSQIAWTTVFDKNGNKILDLGEPDKSLLNGYVTTENIFQKD
jgi:hypothetical protein